MFQFFYRWNPRKIKNKLTWETKRVVDLRESRVNLGILRLKMLNLWVVLCSFLCLIGDFTASGNVVLIGRNVTLAFEDIEANFAPSLTGSGIRGVLYVAEPLDACSSLTNKIVPNTNNTRHPFVLIIRGGCSFEDKVLRAQSAGFKAAIVYDNEPGDLVAMAGEPFYIWIPAVFVSKVSGETLAKYAGAADMELWIISSFENPSWSIIAISFIIVLAMSAVLASCFFMRRHRVRRTRVNIPGVREFHGISSRLVKAMPTLTFTVVLEDNCTSQTCAICLEDYNVGEQLRVLPCYHKFHAACIDTWLTSWRTFCPVCKRDARASTGQPPASESTPLLSSTAPPLSSPSISSPQTLIHNHRPFQSSHPSAQLNTSESSVNQPGAACDIESSGSSSPSESFPRR